MNFKVEEEGGLVREGVEVWMDGAEEVEHMTAMHGIKFL